MIGFDDAVRFNPCLCCGWPVPQCKCPPCSDCGGRGSKDCYSDGGNPYVIGNLDDLRKSGMWLVEIAGGFLAAGPCMMTICRRSIVFSRSVGGTVAGVEVELPFTRFEVISGLCVLEKKCETVASEDGL
jgi:hypothetical protein